MSVIAPLISSSVAGPLGVRHLPRLWLKVLLHACGRLPEGYRHGTGGFDEFVLTTIGVDRDAFVTFVETAKPTYLELEAWVKAHATALTPEAIATVDARISGGELPEQMRIDRLARLGLTGKTAETHAVPLNDLDDWLLLHESLTAQRD